jgi:DNA-binding MarR family transcriptional regulator
MGQDPGRRATRPKSREFKLQRISAGQTSVAEIARSTGYSRQGVQRLADALVAEGSARYSADESDRRRPRLDLTQDGAATFEQMEAQDENGPVPGTCAAGPRRLGGGRCGTMQARSAAAPSRLGKDPT